MSESNNINMRIKKAVSAMTPDRVDEIWDKNVDKADENAWFLEGTGRKRKTFNIYKYTAFAATVAALLMVIVFGWNVTYAKTDSTVYLDVNPSIQIEVNKKSKVLKAEPDNSDGEIILEDMDLKNTDIEVALNAILGSMVKHGYLTDSKNVLLISVDGKDEKRAEVLRDELTETAELTLEPLINNAVVLDQTVDVEDDLYEIADTYGITPGKAALIKKLLEKNPELDIAELAGLSMTELLNKCKENNIDISEYINVNGHTEEIYDDIEDAIEERLDDLEDAREEAIEEAEDRQEELEEAREDAKEAAEEVREDAEEAAEEAREAAEERREEESEAREEALEDAREKAEEAVEDRLEDAYEAEEDRQEALEEALEDAYEAAEERYENDDDDDDDDEDDD